MWERALVVQAHAPPPPRADLADWMGASTDFALEIFFVDRIGRPQFVGVRWIDETVKRSEEILQAAYHTLKRLHGEESSGLDAIREFESALDVRLLRTTPSFLELGVNNLWKSVGSAVVWRRPAPLPSPRELTELLRRHRPQLLNDQVNAVMLEVGYAEPQAHWIGLCVSQPAPSGFRLALDEVCVIVNALAKCSLVTPMGIEPLIEDAD
jgi:hypothetical protein